MLFKDSCIYINLSDKIEVVNLCWYWTTKSWMLC